MRNGFQATAVFVLMLSSRGFLRAQGAAVGPAVRILSPHWVALRFSPEYPHDRHTQNPLPGDGMSLPAPPANFIKGQAGEGTMNKISSAEYRIPVPYFVADSGIDDVALVAEMELSGGRTGSRDGWRSVFATPALSIRGFKCFTIGPGCTEQIEVL
jgi:hypothetical protein